MDNFLLDTVLSSNPITFPFFAYKKATEVMSPKPDDQGKEEPDTQVIGAIVGKDPLLGDLYYAGKDYAPQTLGSFLKVDSSKNPELREKQRILRSRLAGQAAGQASTAGADTIIPDPSQGRGGIPTPPQTPTLPPSTTPSIPQTTDQTIGSILGELQRALDPKTRAELEAINTENAIRRSLVTSALALRQSRERTRREIESQSIQAWREIERSRINANAAQAAAIAQAAYMANVPNYNVATAMSEAFGKAMQPFSSSLLK